MRDKNFCKVKLQGTFVNGNGQARWNTFSKPESKVLMTTMPEPTSENRKIASRNLPQMHDVCNQISTDRKTKDGSDESRDILTEKN